MTRFLKTLLLGAALIGGTGATTILTATTAVAKVAADDFGTLPLVGDAAISPDGTRIAIQANYDGVPGLKIINLSDPTDDKGILLPKGTKAGWVKWTNNERVLMSARRSEEMFGTPVTVSSIYSFDAVSGEGDWLVTPRRAASLGSRVGNRQAVREQFYDDVIDFLPDDPDHILMSFADEYQFVRPVHKVDVRTGKYSTIERANRNIQNWATDTTGTVRVARGLEKNAKSLDDLYIRIKDVDGEWKTGEHWTGLDARDPIYGFMANPAEMVVGSRNGRDTRGLYVYDLGQKRITRSLFHDDTYDVSSVVRDAETGEVIGATYVGEAATTDLFDGYATTMQSLRARFSDFQVDYVDSSDKGETILFRISTPYDPGMLMLKRRGEDKPRKLADYRPDLPSSELGIVVPVRYTASDGMKIPAFVTFPPTVDDASQLKNVPFIILPHGGPFARDAAHFDWFAQFFASRGYGVLQMNFRGSTGYGESFAKAGRENWSVMRSDVIDGANWLVEKGYADPERMCVAGWSYGGYAALMSGVEHADRFDCVVSIAGLSDLEGALKEAEDYRFGKVRTAFIRDGFRDKDDMKANSPVRVVQNMTLPTFIAHGTMDEAVQYDQHRALRNALKKSKAKVTELTLKDDDHYMSDQSNRRKMLRELDKFLTSVNGKSEFMKK